MIKNIRRIMILASFGLCFFAFTIAGFTQSKPETSKEKAKPETVSTPTPAPAPAIATTAEEPADAATEPSIETKDAASMKSEDSEDDTISLDFKDADVGTVLRVLSMKSGVNIVTGPEVKGLVTVRLDNVPWEKALDVILRTYDYVYERDGNIIRVTTRDKMKLEPVETKTFVLNYSKASEIQKAIADILTERGRVKISERTNMLVVTDIPTNVYRIGEVIKKLDQMTTQAFIDSKVVNTKAGAVENMGIQWTPTVSLKGSARPTTFPFPAADNGTPSSLTQFFPVVSTKADPTTAGSDVSNFVDPRAFPYIAPKTSGPTFSYGTLDFSSFQATLNFLKSYSNTKVISNPRITVLNNQTAHIQVGSQVPLPTYERNETTGSMVISGFSYRDTGVVLNVTPHINSAEEILVDLKPEISTYTGDQSFGGDIVAPKFDVTTAKTQLLIKSGQTIAIGGLLTDNTSGSEAKVPYLADVPLVGKLFRSKRQTEGTGNQKVETLFFVTVTTVDTQGQPTGGKFAGKQKSQVDAGEKPAATDAAKSPLKSEAKEPAPDTEPKPAV